MTLALNVVECVPLLCCHCYRFVIDLLSSKGTQSLLPREGISSCSQFVFVLLSWSLSFLFFHASIRLHTTPYASMRAMARSLLAWRMQLLCSFLLSFFLETLVSRHFLFWHERARAHTHTTVLFAEFEWEVEESKK
jgi:hypothetical protein